MTPGEPHRWAPTRRRAGCRGAVMLVAALASGILGAACSGESGRPTGSTLPAAAEAGRQVAEVKGCGACHSADGSPGVGPSFDGLWGSAVELDGGETVTVDRDYLEESVRTPAAKRPAGASGQMPVFDERRVSAAELDAVADYLEALAERSP